MRVLGRLAQQQSSFCRRQSIHNLRSFFASSTSSSSLISRFQVSDASKTSNFAPSISSAINFAISNPWSRFLGQRRTMFIQTQPTPNPSSLMFHPGKPVMDVGSSDFPNARTAMNSPLARSLFGIDDLGSFYPASAGLCNGVSGCIPQVKVQPFIWHIERKGRCFEQLDTSAGTSDIFTASRGNGSMLSGVTRVFFGSDFITVTKSDDVSWDILKPEIFAAIMDFYTSGEPLFLDENTAASKDTAIHEDDSETVAMIKELLETRIRPAVQDDGGDIVYRGFDLETGIVKLRMQGACSGCPSSSVTLKSGIENMLMHYVPEVKGVEQELDPEDEDSVALE